MNVKFFIGTSLLALEDDTTTKLPIFIHDLRPFATGGLDLFAKLSIAVKNIAKNSRQDITSVTLKDHIEADYFGDCLGWERPNVGKGETVAVISFGGNSDFYWLPTGHDQHVRMNECRTMFVSNKVGDPNTPLDQNNAYMLKVDTRSGTKEVTISTNKNQGESHGYTVQIDVENARAILVDTDNNTILIDSKNKLIKLQDEKGDLFSLSQGVITGSSGSSINLKAPQINLVGQILLDGVTTVTKDATFNANENVAGNITVGGGVTAALPYVAPGGVWHNP